MCFGGSRGDGGAAAAREQEAQRQANIQAAIARVNETFSQFGDDFFRQRGDAYSAFAMPELDRQFQDAQRSLGYSLADRGLTRSSVAAKSLADLEREYARSRQAVADEASNYGQQARANVESARGNLINLATSTGDAATVGNSATNEAARLALTPSFSPLGQIFANVGATAGAAQETARANEIRRGGGAKIFGPSSASSRVVAA